MSYSTNAAGVSKYTAERHQRILQDLLQQPGNDICADCKSRAPRWSSWNLGIFICVQCASIHRKIGTHITKVKSVNLDAWSKEQIEVCACFPYILLYLYSNLWYLIVREDHW
ncbi:Arf GTPase activating protein [Ceratobasidium sp. AG-I]|nr:Arf GTPase activating protein [Ceratobasidium sp. AG-I]